MKLSLSEIEVFLKLNSPEKKLLFRYILFLFSAWILLFISSEIQSALLSLLTLISVIVCTVKFLDLYVSEEKKIIVYEAIYRFFHPQGKG